MNKWIDALKGIAICGVIMVHSGISVLPFPISRLGAGGAYGVYIFLVLSAYLSFVSLQHFFTNVEFSWIGCKKWLFRKLIRLAPLFYLSILISVIKNFGNIEFGNVFSHFVFYMDFSHIMLIVF